MSLRDAKALVPWPIKMVAKMVLSRLPLHYDLWQRLHLFRHGSMTDLRYAERVFRDHCRLLPERSDGTAPVLLELGPGDSLLSALLGFRLGASHTYLVDAGRFAVDDPVFYQRAAAELGITLPRCGSTEEVLAGCRASYLTDGVASLRTIPARSVDLVWSQAVLEHVRAADFAETARELRRILRPGGIMSHQVDFKDHLGGRLNSLRFSDAAWEGDLFSRSGFYTNRLRLSGVVRLFEEAGFSVEQKAATRWDTLPTPRARMAPRFAALGDDDLLTADALLVMRPV